MRPNKTKKSPTTAKTKKLPGPPPIQIDYSALNAMLQFKVKKNYVCEYLKISEDTLDRRLKKDHNMTFTDYHNLKLQRTGHMLQRMAIEMATIGKNTAMMIFCLKNIANWCDDPIDSESLNRSISITYKVIKRDDSKAGID